MLTFFDMSNVFHVSIDVVYIVWHILGIIYAGKCIWHLKKTNIIKLKGLY